MLAGAIYDAIFKEKNPKEDKKEEKKKTTSSSIKYSLTVNADGQLDVDPESLEEGVSLVNAQQSYLEGEIKKLQFKIRSAKRKNSDTSAMEKQLNNLKSRYNATLEFGGYDIKGNAENILPLDVNSVSKKATSVSTEASYEETGGETVIIKSGSEEGVPTDTKTKESVSTVLVGSSGGSDEVGDLLYKGG